jgi:hypothetical protein
VQPALNKVNDLKNSVKPGADAIPAILLKSYVHNLIIVTITKLTISISINDYPSIWRVSFITPIFKKDNRQNVENYRSVSSTPPICKILDTTCTFYHLLKILSLMCSMAFIWVSQLLLIFLSSLNLLLTI